MLAEAAILGIIGGAFGSALGILLGRIAIGRLPPALTQGLEARIEYWLPGYAIPAAVVATALTSVIASAMAARQVYKVAPIEALAPAGVSAADRVPRWLRITTGVVAVAVFAVALFVVITQRGIAAFVAMSAVFSAEIALGFGPIDAIWSAALLIAGGAVTPLAVLVWSVVLGCVVSAVAISAMMAREARPEHAQVTVRGPVTYAGPGSLGQCCAERYAVVFSGKETCAPEAGGDGLHV